MRTSGSAPRGQETRFITKTPGDEYIPIFSCSPIGEATRPPTPPTIYTNTEQGTKFWKNAHDPKKEDLALQEEI